MSEERTITVTFKEKEFGVVLTALAHLSGLQGIPKYGNSKENDDYLSSTDSVLRKCCSFAGLPETFIHEIKYKAMRERMVRKNK